MNPKNYGAIRRKRATVIYHFDEACFSVMEPNESISLEELQFRLKGKYGIKFGSRTVAKVLRRIEVERGVSPLKTYCELNPEYYSRIGKHRKGTARIWKKYMKGESELD